MKPKSIEPREIRVSPLSAPAPVQRAATLVGAILAAATFGLTATSAPLARAATRSATGCNPADEYCDPGPLHAGVYTTRYFLPGMRVNVPGSGWSSAQDSTTEFKLTPPGYPNPKTAPTIRFWIDPRATTPCADTVLPTNMTTPARAVRWLRTNTNFVVSTPKRATIAEHLAALRVDLDLSPNAPQCDPTCPGPCIDYFAFFGGTAPDAPDLAPGHTPGIKDGFGTGRGELVRLYFAEIGRPSHVFVVGIDTPNKKIFAALTASTPRLLAHLRLPAKLPPKQP